MNKSRLTYVASHKPVATTVFQRNPVKTLVGIGLAGGFMVAMLFHSYTSISDDWKCLERSWFTGSLVETECQ